MLALASLSEEIEIKIIPMAIKTEIKKISGDLGLTGFIGRLDYRLINIDRIVLN